MPAEKDDFLSGRLIGVSKRETKVRSDFEITGPMRDWLTVIRPLQHIVRDHAEIMVERDVMTEAESLSWINLHWELICTEPEGISSGGVVMCYGRERNTVVAVDVKRQGFEGYERIRMKAFTYLLPRAGAGDDETDPDDLSTSGVSARRAALRMQDVPSSTGSAEPPPGSVPDVDDFIAEFGSFDAFEEAGPSRSERVYDDDEKWVRAAYDEERSAAFAEYMAGEREARGSARELVQRLADAARRGREASKAMFQSVREREGAQRARTEAAAAAALEQQAALERKREQVHEKLREMTKKALESKRGSEGEAERAAAPAKGAAPKA